MKKIQCLGERTVFWQFSMKNDFCFSFVTTGDEPWPYGYTLKFYGGHQMTHEERFLLPELQPGQSWTLQMQFTSPDKPGLYESQWRFSAITGQCFGGNMFCSID